MQRLQRLQTNRKSNEPPNNETSVTKPENDKCVTASGNDTSVAAVNDTSYGGAKDGKTNFKNLEYVPKNRFYHLMF